MNSHFIELDIILKSKSKPWIIDKNNPNSPIMKISIDEFNLFKSGVLQSQRNKIEFNGKSFWVSNEFINKLKIISKKNKIDISNLGISMQEFLNPDISNTIEFDLNLDIFRPIINTNDDIYIISSNNTKLNYQPQIQKLEEKLLEIGLSIKKYYFISETFYNKNIDEIAYLKSKIILQHLLGLKTNGDTFTKEEIEDYDQITFYDDNLNSIETIKNINLILSKILNNSEDSIKLVIKDKIKNDNNNIIIKEFTHNRANKFKEYNIQLEFSNLLKKFESFKYKD